MIREKINYFIVAFAVYLLGKSVFFFNSTPALYLVFDVSIAVSLLCSSVPRVLAVPYRYLLLMHKADKLFLGIALTALLFIFMH